jgi:CheY-like chemotaxis protein
MDAAEIPVADILQACARELADLAARCLALQGAVAAPAATSGAVEALQALDLITQRSQGLSQFVGLLAQEMQPAWRVDPGPAAAALSLADLADAHGAKRERGSRPVRRRAMSFQSAGEPRLNLTKATVLLVQGNPTELDILGQVFIGFGVKAIRKCQDLEEADAAVRKTSFDLIIVDSSLPDGLGFDFVARLRRMEDNPNRLAPMLVVCGHTAPSMILRARDCGANFVVAKPITPKVMFDRVMWLAREERQFVDSEGYAGPDRRHKSFGPPAGMKGRRHDDLSAEVGRPIGPDMSQSDIDALLNPKRAVA